MNSGDPNKAEIQLDIVGDAVEKVKELAKAFDSAADAEERMTKNAERNDRILSSLARRRAQEMEKQRREEERRQNRVSSGLARQRIQEEERTQRESEQRRSRVTSSLARRRFAEQEKEQREERERRQRVYGGLARQRLQEERQRETERRSRPLTEQQEAGRRILAAEREERVRQAMGRFAPGAKPGGLTGLAERIEAGYGMEGGPLSSMVGKAKGMIGPAGGTAALMAAGKFGLDTMTTVNDQMQYGSPYADGFTTERNIFANLPMSKEFYAAKDLITGRAQGMERVNKRRIEEEARAPVRWEAMQRQAELERERRTAELNAGSVRLNRLPDAPSGDRRTLSQQQGYQLAQRLLPLQEQLTEASTTRAEAENAVTAAQERQK